MPSSALCSRASFAYVVLNFLFIAVAVPFSCGIALWPTRHTQRALVRNTDSTTCLRTDCSVAPCYRVAAGGRSAVVLKSSPCVSPIPFSVPVSARPRSLSGHEKGHPLVVQSCPNDGYDYGEPLAFCPDVDAAMSCLVSPAPESFDILQRAVENFAGLVRNDAEICDDCMAEKQLSNATSSIAEVSSVIVKDGHCVLLKRRGHSIEFQVVENDEASTEHGESDVLIVEKSYDASSVLQLAHQALDLATKASLKGLKVDVKAMDHILECAKRRIHLLQSADLRGRTSADAALTFALAGVKEDGFFSELARIGLTELCRFGQRSSCKPKHVLQMVEKFAASGVRPGNADLYQTAVDILKQKGCDESLIETILPASWWGMQAASRGVGVFQIKQPLQHVLLTTCSVGLGNPIQATSS
uniref:Uncharacterized protein n=1 Tax=Odontella aurita TaxID=265563 RepID=A0A7S4I170_9STRA|mmetsp:Transcript_18249/g.52712  ORF Transcript_18249/g.52712 Transcript_18249/m.52712 type:complete len:414 (+) Transcript_18249:424-1665(+)